MEISGALLDGYINFLRESGKSEHTIIAYKTDLKQFFEFMEGLGKTSIEEISHDDIYSYLKFLEEERGLHLRSAVRKLVVVKGFFDFLVEKGRLEKMKSPLLGFSLPKVEEKPPRVLKPVEYLALREATRSDPRLHAIFEVLLQTGIRVGELTRLKLDDLKFTPKGRPYLVIREYGSNPMRMVPLPNKAYEALKRYLKHRPKLDKEKDSGYIFITRNGRQIPARNIREMMKRLMDKVGIEGATVNDLRNTFIVHQLKNGMDLVTLARLVGHKRLSTTERYLRYIHSGFQGEESDKKVVEDSVVATF